MARHDVLVVGAGPAGCAAAKKCADAGLSTLLIDRCVLPRRKACSGIITNESQNYVLENFGPIPESAFGKPYASRGVAFYFPGVGPMFMDSDCYAPYVWRDKFDYFLAEKSGATLQDQTRFLRLEQNGGKLTALLKYKGKVQKKAVRYVVGADGGFSRVIHSFAPDVYQGVHFAFACQKYFEGTVDADDRYLYWFLLKGVSPYPWLNIKDGQIIIGVGNGAGNKFRAPFETFVEYLKKNLGLKLGRELATEGCKANFMTPLNRFFPGRGPVLMVGDAMGLMHQGGEGISCALKSGGLAGQAIAQGMKEGRDPLPIYKNLVRPEMVRALDQFNPLRARATATSGTYRAPSSFKSYGRLQRARILLDTALFIKSEVQVPGLYPTVMKNMVRRLVLKDYKVGVVE